MKKSKSRFLSGPQRAVFIPPRTAIDVCRAELLQWLPQRRFSGKFAPRPIDRDDALEVENIDFRTLLEASTHLKCAADIRWLAYEFKADTYAQFKSRLAAFDWPAYFGHGHYRVKISSIRSRLYHEAQLTDIFSKIIQSQSTADNQPPKASNAIFVQLIEDQVRVWISMRGTQPQHRAYITDTRSRASMRAPLVASILAWGFDQLRIAQLRTESRAKITIWNPFCGSGVFGFELCARFEGLTHQSLFDQYPWQHWPFVPAQSRSYFSAPLHQKNPTEYVGNLLLEDIDPRQVEAAQIHQNHFEEGICAVGGATRIADFFESEPWKIMPGPFVVVANPPFGERLKPSDAMPDYFAEIGTRLQEIQKKTQQMIGGTIIAPSKPAAAALMTKLGVQFKPQAISFRTGGKPIEAVRF